MTMEKKKGSALATVIIIAAVLGILGTAILTVTLGESVLTAKRGINMKAKYIARAGADAAMRAWFNSTRSNKPSGTAATMYLQSSGDFSQTPTSLGSFSVTVTNTEVPESGGIPSYTKATIVSTGVLGSATQKATVTIDRNKNVKYGSDLGWYSYTSGQINTDTSIHETQGVVIIQAKDSNKLKMPNQNTDPVSFITDYMFIESPLDELMHNKLNLYGDIIVFEQTLNSINLAADPLNDAVTLNSYSGVRGRVFFADGAGGYIGYYFDNGTNLLDPLQRITGLEVIGSGDPYSLIPIYSYSVIWS